MDTSNQQRNASRSKLSLRRKKETSPPPKSVSSDAVCAMQPQPLKETLESPSRQDSSGLPRCSVVLRRCAPLRSPMKRDAQSDVRSTECRQNSPPHGVECGTPMSPCDEDTNQLSEEEHASSSFRHTQGKLCVGSSEEIDYPSQTFPRASSQTSQDPFSCLICKADLSCCSLAEREEHINSCCDKALEKGIEFHSAVEGYETTSHDCPLCERMFPSRQDILIHSKSCAQVHGIDTAQLIDVLHVQEAEWMNDTMGQSLEKASKVEESQREGAVAMDCAGDEVKEKVGALSGVPADCDFTKPPLPSAGWTRSKTRKRTRNEPHSYFHKLEKEQLQLAIALSASINPLKEGDENEGTISGRTKRPRRTKKAIAVPPLLMTSASQAKSIIAGRADQILCDAAKPHADDDVPCTPVFVASRLTEAAESTSQEDDDLCSIRELLHGKIGEGTVSDNAASSEKMADAGAHVDEDVHADENPGGVMYDNVSSVLVQSAREVAIKGTRRRGGVILGEDDDRGSVPVTAPSVRETEIARSVASGFDNQEELCYQTLWQLSHCAENEECSNFYVPALINVIPPQKIPLHCKVCRTEACLAVMFPRSSCNHQNSEPSPFSDQITPLRGTNSEAKRFGVPRLLDDLGRLVGSRLLSDVSISTQGGSEIPAHAAILAARCPTLLKELTVSNLPPFRLDFSHHTDATVLAFLEYVYTGNYPQRENEIHWHNFLSLTTELCVEEFKDEASTACTTALITRPSKKLAHCSPATDTMLLNSETQSNSDSNGGFQLIEGIDFGSAAHNTETLLHAGPMHSDVGRLASTSEPHPPQNESKAMPSFRISELPTSPRSCSPELLSGSSAPSSPSSHPLLPTPPPPTSPRYETRPSTARSPSYPPSPPVVQPLFVPPSSPVVVISSPSPEVARQPAAVSPVTSSQPMDMATSSGELTPQEQTSAAVGAPEYCEHSNVLISTCGTILPTHTEGSDSTGKSEKASPDRELDGKVDCIGGSMASRILLDKGPSDLSAVTSTSSDSVQEICMADASDWYHNDEAIAQPNEVNSPPVVFDSTSTGVDWDREACLLLSDAGGCMQGAQEQDSNGQHHSQVTETTPLRTPCCTSRVACPDVIDSPRELNLQAIGSDLTPLHLHEAPSMIRSNLGLYATPTGSRVLLESDDITPMPEYRVMHTPALKSVCSQFGVKHLPKKKMILKLEEIYDYTHPLVDEVGKIVQAPSLLDLTSGEVNRVQAECPERQGTREASKKKTTKTKKVTKKADTSDVDSGCSQSSVEREPAHIVKECISLHPELHRDILLYKPVELSCFQAKLKASGSSLSKDKVADALDFLCVTYTQPRGDRPSKKTGRSRDHDTNHPS